MEGNYDENGDFHPLKIKTEFGARSGCSGTMREILALSGVLPIHGGEAFDADYFEGDEQAMLAYYKALAAEHGVQRAVAVQNSGDSETDHDWGNDAGFAPA